MARLTKREGENITYSQERKIECSVYCDECSQGTANCKTVREMVKKLADYEDAEEQGLLVRLPSKEVYLTNGDIVYYIYDYEIVECINCGISIDCDGRMWIVLACDEHIFPYRRPIAEIDTDPTDWCKNTTEVSIDDWGKTVFLTKEEAEQALKKIEKGV